MFLAAHPEFAVEAKQAAAPFGPSPTSRHPSRDQREQGAARRRPGRRCRAGRALPRVRAPRRRGARASGAARTGPPIAATGKQIDEQLAQAQGLRRGGGQAGRRGAGRPGVEVEPHRGPPGHARGAHGGRCRRAPASRGEGRRTPASSNSRRAACCAAGPAQVPPEVAEKLRQVNGQIATRRAQLAKSQARSPRQRAGREPRGHGRRRARDRVAATAPRPRRGSIRAMTTSSSEPSEPSSRSRPRTCRPTSRWPSSIPPFVRPIPSKGGRTNTALAGLRDGASWWRSRTRPRASPSTTRLIDADDIEALGLLPVLCVVPEDRAARAGVRPRREATAMQPPDDGSPVLALALGGGHGLRRGDRPVAVPVWASPPNSSILVMLGETRADAPAALRVLRHRLELRRAEGLWTFGVTSARDGEGKSTLAAQLALVLSEAQRATRAAHRGEPGAPDARAPARLPGSPEPRVLGADLAADAWRRPNPGRCSRSARPCTCSSRARRRRVIRGRSTHRLSPGHRSPGARLRLGDHRRAERARVGRRERRRRGGRRDDRGHPQPPVARRPTCAPR